MSCTDLVVHVHHVRLHLRVGITQVVDLLVELLDVLVVVQNYMNHGAVRTSAVVQDYVQSENLMLRTTRARMQLLNMQFFWTKRTKVQ